MIASGGRTVWRRLGRLGFSRRESRLRRKPPQSGGVVAGSFAVAGLASPFLNAHTLKESIEMVLKNRSQRTPSRRAAVALALLAVVVIPAGVRGVAEARDEQAQAAPPKPGDDVAAAQAQSVERAKHDQPASDQGKPLAKKPKLLQGTFRIEKLRSDKGLVLGASVIPSEADAEAWRTEAGLDCGRC